MTIRLLILSLFITIGSINQVSAKRKKSQRIQLKEAEKKIKDKNYIEASKILLQLMRIDPEDPEYNFNLGRCYFYINSKKKLASDFFEKSIKYTKNKDDVPNRTYNALGRAYHKNYRFPEALKVFNELLKRIDPKDVKFRDKVARQIEYCNNAIELVKNPVNISVVLLGDRINSIYTEHSPSITADEETMIFTSSRPSKDSMLVANGEYTEDIYISHKINNKWTQPLGIAEINTPNDDASISISADGQDLFVYKSTIENKGDIYISHLDGDRWTKPFRLDEGINTPFQEGHISISANAQTMYFTSDRPGGYGGTDIYRVNKLPNNSWGKAQNLGPTINTKYNESGSFIHPDGKTFYFSSAGHKSMGGLDIFKSVFENGSWTTPKNVGYPINSTEDDMYYMPTTDGKRAYLASYREGSMGKTDIFMISTPEQEAKGLFVLKGMIISTDKSAIGGAIISVKFAGKNIGMYNTNKATGKFLFIVEAGKKYDVEIFAEGFKTFKTVLNVPLDYANKENNSVITLVPVALKTISEEGDYEDTKIEVDFKKSKIKKIQKKEIIKDIIKEAVKEVKTQSPIEKNSEAIIEVEYTRPEKVVPTKYYTVQIKAMKFPVGKNYFSKITDKSNIKELLGDDNITRYTYRIFTDYDEAVRMKKECRSKGYWDSFVRTVINGQVLDVNKKFVSSVSTYTIQVMALSNPKPLYFFNDIGHVNQYINRNLYHYSYKTFRTKNEAKRKLSDILKNGYWDAFVRKSFLGESRIPRYNKTQEPVNKYTVEPKQEYIYTIQLNSSEDDVMPEEVKFMQQEKVVTYRNYDGISRYTYKKFVTFQEANRELQKLRKKIFPDAFIREISWYKK